MHVGADFGDNDFGATTLEPGNGLQPGEGVVKISQTSGNVLGDDRELPIQQRYVLQLEQQPLMGIDQARERRDEGSLGTPGYGDAPGRLTSWDRSCHPSGRPGSDGP